MTHGSLFAGIGGFDLGFERAGIRTLWQVEIDPYCRRVLAKHFPEAIRFEDVRTVGRHNLPYADIISGGFPCQDISNAGKRAGIDGERSGLWSEYARIIRELRPRYVVVENVAALLGRGMERVLGDLAACGYNAEWQSIRASDVGAPHRRERIWIVAYPERGRRRQSTGIADSAQESFRKEEWPESAFVFRSSRETTLPHANASGFRRSNTANEIDGPTVHRGWDARNVPGAVGTAVSDDDGERFAQLQRERPTTRTSGSTIPYADPWWKIEPNVDRVADGIPDVVDRLRGLGNAIVPQIGEWIGRRIIDAAGRGIATDEGVRG